MTTIYLKESLKELVDILWMFQEELHVCGLGFSKIIVCKRTPTKITPSDFLIWEGNGKNIPKLPSHATGQIRSRKTGSFGLIHSIPPSDLFLLTSRWEEVETQGKHRIFQHSVADDEREMDDLSWVIDRLKDNHSYSYNKKINWTRLKNETQKRLDLAEHPSDFLRAWEWLFAKLKDGHTKVLGLEGSQSCRRVHCGVFGRFIDPNCFLIEKIQKQSAAKAAGLKPGMHVLAVNGMDWETFLRLEKTYWCFSSYQSQRAKTPFITWSQPMGTDLQLKTDKGKLTIHFGTESYPGFFLWRYPERPDPVVFKKIDTDRYRLRIAFFAPGNDFVSQCRKALMSIPKGSILEIDLRGNSGMSGISMRKLLGMLLPKDSPVYRARTRLTGGSFTPWTVYHNPDEPIYDGTLRVLMDEYSASASENFIGAIKSTKRGKLIGRRTAGSTGNPNTFLSLNGVHFICSSWEHTLLNGEPIQGHGITTR